LRQLTVCEHCKGRCPGGACDHGCYATDSQKQGAGKIAALLSDLRNGSISLTSNCIRVPDRAAIFTNWSDQLCVIFRRFDVKRRTTWRNACSLTAVSHFRYNSIQCSHDPSEEAGTWRHPTAAHYTAIHFAVCGLVFGWSRTAAVRSRGNVDSRLEALSQPSSVIRNVRLHPSSRMLCGAN
jgi:hypothetical protein